MALTRDDRFTSVEKNVFLEGVDGPRQIDILLRSTVANLKLLTVVECRDYGKRLDITQLDAFHSKLLDVNASKGVLVSRKGFSKKATAKAKRLGIALSVATEANELLDGIGIQIPLRVSIVQSALSHVTMSILAERDITLSEDAIFNVNGISLPDAFRREMLDNTIATPSISSTVRWSPKNINGPCEILDVDGASVAVEGLDLSVEFTVRNYYGHVSQLPDLPAFHDLDNGLATILLPAEKLPDISRLTEFRSLDSMPSHRCANVVALQLPTKLTGRTQIHHPDFGLAMTKGYSL